MCRLIALGCCVIAHASVAVAGPTLESGSVDQGIVVAPASNTVFVMDATDGVVALDLRTGKRRWAAKQLAAKPFALRGTALVALDEARSIRILDARTGKLHAKCPTIPGIAVDLVDGLGSRQTSHGGSDGKRAWITWSRSTHYAGGAAPTPDVERAARSSSSGVYEIDIAACKATTGVDPFAPKADEYTTPTNTTFRFDPKTKKLSRSHGNNAKPDIDLKHGALDEFHVVSTDRRHVLAGQPVTGKGFDVDIVDVDSGTRVANLLLPTVPSGFVVVGKLLVFGRGAAYVVDLRTAKQLWMRGTRPTGYAGPYPPSAPPRR